MDRRLRPLLASLTLVMFAGCTAAQAPVTTVGAPQPQATTSLPVRGDAFDQFVDEAFLALLQREPETATGFGLGDELGVGGELNDLSERYGDATMALLGDTLDELRGFDTSSLDENQIVTRDAFEWHLEQMLARNEFLYHDWPVHFLVTSYNHGLFGLFTEIHPLTNRNQIEDFLARLESVDLQVGQMMQRLETSVAMNVRPPKYVIDITVDQLRSQTGAPDRHPIVTSFRERVAELGLNQATVTGYEERAVEAVRSSFIPAWTRLADFLEAIGSQTNDEISLSRLTDGDGFYRYLVEFHTSTDLAPDEIHQMGRTEADRVVAEMVALGEQAGYETAEIGELRSQFATDAGFVASPSVVDEYSTLISEATSAFEPFFSAVPSTPLEVVNDPGPVAFYLGPPLDGSRPGSFHAGTGGGNVPKYRMKSLTHHEAIPGHHFQIALAQEMDELPLIQRLVSTTGHVEGWALYAERLASDIGLYENDMASDFGRLDFELLRAARLVVDTGIHHHGWSRERAISEMTQIMGGTEYNLEVDRYVVYPGQATAYMVGMLRILQLREELGVDLDDPSSLAAFHDVIIGRGNLPLAVLGGA